jgi:uncharacterized protein
LSRASGAKRYLVVGGAGSLEVAPGIQGSRRGRQRGTFYRQRSGNAGRGGAPSAMFVPGERTGKFRLGKDALLTNDKGSSISFEDYAIALVDEIEKPAHSRQRFTVGY